VKGVLTVEKKTVRKLNEKVSAPRPVRFTPSHLRSKSCARGLV
jgi:hypothetical protein